MARFSIFGLVATAMLTATAAHAKVLPQNTLNLSDRIDSGTGISQDQFNAVIDRANKLFSPIISSFGGSLTINRLWDDTTVNADSDQEGSTWTVNMYGGLARRAEVTVDGFALVLCHELGHHLGGFPFFDDSPWAAVEGQADYFATTHCAHVIWDNDSDNAASRAVVAAVPKAACDAAWSTIDSQNLCYRTAMGAKSLADLLAALDSGTVDFSTPDPSQVDSTDSDHPAAQCRLDTYMAGATCTAPYDNKLIPGKVDGSGTNTVAAENESGKNYCESTSVYSAGFRPRCWFKPGI